MEYLLVEDISPQNDVFFSWDGDNFDIAKIDAAYCEIHIASGVRSRIVAMYT